MRAWLTRVLMAVLSVEYAADDVDVSQPPTEFTALTFVRCSLVSSDAVATRAVKDRGIVTIEAHDNGEPIHWVAVSAGDARRFAAGLLNAADEVDGTTALVFMPEGGPTGEEPVR